MRTPQSLSWQVPGDKLNLMGKDTAPHHIRTKPVNPLRVIFGSWVAGSLILTVIYALVFIGTSSVPALSALIDASANVLPLSVLAAGIYVLTEKWVMHLPWQKQVVVHAGLSLVFAVTWYALVIVFLAFFSGLRGRGFDVFTFSGPAFTWQAFQGLILYSTIAAMTYAFRPGVRRENAGPGEAPILERYLTRLGDEMVPIQVRDIVSIASAQDYSEVSLASGKQHLVRMSLSTFEARLDPHRFLRVHRSTIINFDFLARAEPAGGGRMLAHLVNNETVSVSRAGAKRLRDFLV